MAPLEQDMQNVYERARWRWSAFRAVALIPFGLSGTLVGAETWHIGLLTTVLLTSALVGGWWRSGWSRGALAGAWVSLVPVGLGQFICFFGPSMSEQDCMRFCLTTSIFFGGIAGFWLTHRAGEPTKNGWFVGGSLSTAILSMSVGCMAIGFGSVFGLGLGLLATGLPTYALAVRSE